MASYSVNRAKHATLAAGVVDTVTITNDYPLIEIENRDLNNDLWFTIDGSVPAAGADDVLHLGPSMALTIPTKHKPAKLISTSGAAYSVTGWES